SYKYRAHRSNERRDTTCWRVKTAAGRPELQNAYATAEKRRTPHDRRHWCRYVEHARNFRADGQPADRRPAALPRSAQLLARRTPRQRLDQSSARLAGAHRTGAGSHDRVVAPTLRSLKVSWIPHV